MHEAISQLLSYLRGVWRFRWTALLMAWFVALGAWSLVYYIPDQYEANARVHVDTHSILKPLLEGMVVETNTQQRLRLMSKTLLSRPNLEKVARMTDMDLAVDNRVEMEALIDKLRERIRLEATGKLNLYEISYQDTDPKQAKQVVQSLLTLFVEKSLGESREDNAAAQDFLKSKLKEYEQRLEKAEQRLMEFKRKHTGEMPNEQGDYYQRLQSKMAKLERTRMKLESAQQRRDALQKQLAGEKPTYGVMERTVQPAAGSSGPSQLDQRISKLQQELDQLRLQYTNKHPDVQNLVATIENLKQQRQSQQPQQAPASSRTASRGSTGSNLATNDYYQSLRTSLAEAKAEVAELKSQASQYEKQVETLKQKVDTIPQVEAKLAQLNRSYRVNKKNYEKLLARLQSARISEEVGRSTDDVKFQVVDPPQVPVEPVAPNRPLLVSGGLFGSVGAGLVLGVLMAQIRPVFDSRRSLFEATGLPVVGTVSQVNNRATSARKRTEALLYLVGMVLLLLAYGVAMAIAFWGTGPIETWLSAWGISL
ncbi:XrtA system polysaccharide chain length determinant [Thiohalorhabdus methylotrophus]|uniref:XrtA system polysaccharide chain length determinant n=1 Tax=Thiohalorhabdus methylotrophus TaxID=3242694 RepID=A0ABV4TWM8_9GAMM